jgi:aminopeptidase N
MRSPRILAGALALLVAGVLAAPAAAARDHPPPSPGAPGVGDRLFPTLGNGGYDARHYDLALTYPTTTPEQDVSGTVTMLARATQSLSRFNLDFAGDTVTGVWVGGRRAGWTRAGEELVVTPRRPLRKGKKFAVTVRFVSGPFTPAPDDDVPFGWFTTVDGSVTAGQPDHAHEIYPVNDHPVDMASYTIRFDVPEGVTAVASGELRWSATRAGRTRSVYVMEEPMASELIQLAVGDLEVVEQGSAAGVRLRDVLPSSQVAAMQPQLQGTAAQMRWLVDRVGRYPFDSYGSLAADREFGYALETQTLSLYPAFAFLPDFPEAGREPLMVHELAHQWFGDSVAPESWSDLWLNEGHATWYEWLYGDEFFVDQVPGYDFVPRVREAYSHGDQWRALYGPVARPSSSELFELFSPNVYDGGAVVLYALRQVIGEEAFAELQRRWAQHYAGRSVGTEDFIALASRVAHRDLGPFLRDWVYGTETPPMPGHPDWTVLPADTPLETARVAARSARELEKR